MALNNYTNLKAAIASWLNREDLASQIPDFIALAEARFNRDLRLNAMLQRATISATSDNAVLPNDWLEHVSVTVVNDGTIYRPLTYVTNEEFNRLRHQNLTGSFRYYTIQEDNIALLPAMSSGTVSLEMFYYGKIPALSDSNTTNWLLTRAPDLYLYGALVAAEMYLANDERLPVWLANVEKIMDDLRMESERAKRPQGALAARKRTFG